MMKIVQKFGGTSLQDAPRVAHVAQRIKDRHSQGVHLAVVVSAMGDETDRLASLYHAISDLSDESHDMVLASGEQVSVALLVAALKNLNVPARGFCGWQLPIVTDTHHGAARVVDVQTQIIESVWQENGVAVVAGFQGVTKDNRITTLGRGGSDTTAVALAIALKAHSCEIYTDVDGVYSADPRLVPRARKHDTISYEEMLEMASSGSRVLHARASALAMGRKMALVIRSSLTQEDGTVIKDEEQILEKADVTAVTHRTEVAKVTLTKVADRPGVAADIFQTLLAARISVDMIVQNIAAGTKKTDITFTIDRSDVTNATQLLQDKKQSLGYDQLLCDETLAQCSIVGVGMREHAGVAALMFQTLAMHKINIEVISTSEIKISILIKESVLATAVRALHDAFQLS